jgi:carbon catabolite-derepressing protein kinase
MQTLRVEIGEEDVDIPLTFSSYEVIKVIGTGAFSVAILLHDRVKSTNFACKVVSRNFLLQSGTFHRFEQEIRLLEMIHHPHIVEVVDIIYADNLIFVVMEFCSGGELFQYLVDHGRIRETDCRRLFSAIVSAVSYLHSRGIAHRDLKPENILLSDGLVPKIADLGLCHLVTNDSLMTTPCGSVQYAAPEVLSGKGYDGRASDVWSLGVVLFVMATATVPWRSTTQTHLFEEITQADYNVPGYLTPELRQLIQAMMNPDPAARPAIGEIAKHPWVVAETDEFGLPISTGIVKTTSLECRPARKGLRKGESGKSLILKPSLQTSMTLGPRKVAPAPLEALLRRVPPSGGRGRPAGLQKMPSPS